MMHMLSTKRNEHYGNTICGQIVLNCQKLCDGPKIVMQNIMSVTFGMKYIREKNEKQILRRVFML